LFNKQTKEETKEEMKEEMIDLLGQAAGTRCIDVVDER
jgi:hypothetical protein